MNTEHRVNLEFPPQLSGSGSVAHSIIGQFIAELGKKEGFTEIAKALEGTVYDSPSEATLRAALFGDEPI